MAEAALVVLAAIALAVLVIEWPNVRQILRDYRAARMYDDTPINAFREAMYKAWKRL